MSKQDRAPARTASDLERRLNLGKTFAEVMGIATDAQEIAKSAQSEVIRAQQAANDAKEEADNAKAAADSAQALADSAEEKAQQAKTELTAAQQELLEVTSRVGATEQEIAAAQEAVNMAQEAADKAEADAEAAQATADIAEAEAAKAQAAAEAAQKAADEAKQAVNDLDTKLNAEEVFNRLTNNGALQGLYRGDDGELYINATYIKSGEFLADLIKAGVIKSKDGESVVIDLDNGTAELKGKYKTVDSDAGSGHVQSGELMPAWIRLLTENRTAGRLTNHAHLTSHYLEIGNEVPKYILLDVPTHDGGYDTISVCIDDLDFGGIDFAVSQSGKYVSADFYNDLDDTHLKVLLQNGRAAITGLTAPVDSADAANKEYVDDLILGISNTSQYIDSWNNAKKPGSYVTWVDSPNGGYWYGMVMANSMFNQNTGTWLVQRIYNRSSYGSLVCCERSSSDGGETWDEWEFVNPPMTIGTEYRTTERWNGSVVYSKVVDYGKAGDGATLAAPTGATRIVRYAAFLGPYLMPIGEKGETNSAYVISTIPDLGLTLRKNGVGNYTTYVQYWYIKD